MTRPSIPFILMALVAILTSGPIQAKEPDWSDYAALLKEHVTTEQHHGVRLNWVSYGRLRQDPRWPRLLKQMEGFSPQNLSTDQERLAFYINAYNIMAIKVVVDNWPLESIKDVGNLLWPVWKRTAGRIGGKEVTLNEIEHEILRPMGEPRIHFAIVCASTSCPDLRKEPFTAAKLDEQLDEQAAGFLGNAKKGLRQDGGGIRVSKIFSWFEDDFGGESGVKAFIQHYRPLPAGASIQADLPYDWRLNGD
ncbi:MAG TPA: DUF547 domain-containing protein [Sedimenticola sp.]|nr:DUF547 domain-containing protein [Sedimenticola sp.]